MDHALNAALDGQKLGEVPIGCVIIDENKNILSLTHNRVIGDNDPTAHAEILAIREACSKTVSYTHLTLPTSHNV